MVIYHGLVDQVTLNGIELLVVLLPTKIDVGAPVIFFRHCQNVNCHGFGDDGDGSFDTAVECITITKDRKYLHSPVVITKDTTFMNDESLEETTAMLYPGDKMQHYPGTWPFTDSYDVVTVRNDDRHGSTSYYFEVIALSISIASYEEYTNRRIREERKQTETVALPLEFPQVLVESRLLYIVPSQKPQFSLDEGSLLTCCGAFGFGMCVYDSWYPGSYWDEHSGFLLQADGGEDITFVQKLNSTSPMSSSSHVFADHHFSKSSYTPALQLKSAIISATDYSYTIA
ncbi:hypothetical protein TrVFT333_002156 [Trichoderma virens FT-333]|nr:hypothetical protein TrVFT333_002156 [Trichoderma virens FT-333]